MIRLVTLGSNVPIFLFFGRRQAMRSWGMVGEARGWPMHTRSGRCSIFAMRTASDYLPRVARPPRSGSSAHSAIADIPLWSSSPL